MIYRSKTEIISVILQTTDSGASITKIMYNSYLSYSLTKKYVDFLMENKMITYDEKMHHYKTTEKGRRFTRMYGEINKMFNSKLNKSPEF
jgi:predicted transcriptional regulator